MTRPIEVVVLHRTEASTSTDWSGLSVVKVERLPVVGEYIEIGDRWFRVDVVVHSTKAWLRSEVFATEMRGETVVALFEGFLRLAPRRRG